MSIDSTRLTKALAAIIDETRRARGFSIEELARESGITYGTLRNITKPSVDMKAPDLVAIAAAFSTRPLRGGSDEPTPVTGADLLELAITRAGGLEALVSAADATKDDLETRRLQKEAAEMSLAEIEGSAIAATSDPERRADETPAP